MSYLALYRAFRPKAFEEIIGQDHIVRTLVNQINTNRVGHAYLFCGARGTGKTTMAKVFARAINCTNSKNGSPCGECEACKALASPANLDITEMDAASNNKVENVRDLREKVQYPPVAGRYKVYIIDEVHMLTTEAFNALLKTLEEPPAHAVFILATTEVHKIPATILSRCLRFDFKLIPTPQIAKFICEIYDKLGKAYEPEAVGLIAKAGEGSVRDALSIADICVSFSENKLTYDDVLEVLGTSDRAKIEQLINNIFVGDTGSVLSVVDELCMRGKSVSILNRDVCSVLRDLLIIKTCSNSAQILAMPEDKLKELKKIASNVDVHGVLRAIEIFSTVENDLKYSTHPKIVFETAAVKAGLPQADYNIDALMSRISKLETALENGEFKRVITTERVVEKVVEKPVEKIVEPVNQVEKPVGLAEDTLEILQVKKQEQVEVKQQSNAFEKSEKSTYNTVNEQNQQSFYDDYDADLQSLIAEAQKSGYYGDEDQIGFDTVKKQEPKVEKQPEIKKVVEKPEVKIEINPEIKLEPQKTVQTTAEPVKTVTGSSKIAWGVVLRKLRADKEIMLWVACQDVSVTQNGDVVIICAPGDNEYNLLSRTENLAKLNAYVQAEGARQVKVVKDLSGEIAQEQTDNETQAVKDMFAGECIDIKD